MFDIMDPDYNYGLKKSDLTRDQIYFSIDLRKA